ncbi:MAG: hypothetical protein ABIO72_00950 [Patescibacteria group bacterium]
MPTPRTILLIVVSFFVSAMVAKTARADLASCQKACELTGRLVCGSASDIKKACAGIADCDALSADDAKVADTICDQCRAGQQACDVATPPVVTPSTTPTTPATPTTNGGTKPTMTAEQFCKMQGYVMVDGVCMTPTLVGNQLIELRKDVNELKKKDEVTDEQIVAIKSRIEKLETASNMPEQYKTYLKKIIDSNMGWVNERFEAVDYRMGLQDVSNAAISQRIDTNERVIGQVNDRVKKLEKSPQSGFLGFQAGGFVLAHPRSLNDDTVFEVGGKVRWVPKLVEHLRLPIGIGGAYGGDTPHGSATVLHIEGGLMLDVANFFHLEGGFIMDRAFVDDSKTAWSFMGGYFQPELCLPNDLTACLQLTAAVGGMNAFRKDEGDVTTMVDGELGASIVISYLP